MGRPLNVLAVAGFQIKLDDGSNFWKLVDSLKSTVLNLTIEDRTWNPDDTSGVKDEDLIGRDVIICYSWGVASVFMAFARLKAAGKLSKLPLLIIMAGVPRGIAQCIEVSVNGGWDVPSEVAEAVCLQVNSIPASHPIRNSGPDRVNILITGIPGNDHVGIQNFPAAHDVVVNLVAASAAALA